MSFLEAMAGSTDVSNQCIIKVIYMHVTALQQKKTL